MQRILLIEDDRSIRTIIALQLRNLGHQVEVAEDGEKGIKVFIKPGNFDLVITDIRMPRRDGNEVAKHIRSSERPETPIAAISACRDEVQKDLFNFALLKPFRSEELITIIKSLEHEGRSLVLRPIEGKTMADSVNRRELPRLSVSWPMTIRTETGEVDGETRNITGEGMFLYCSERLHEGTVYPVTIKLPEKRVDMRGNVTWSNLDSCTSLNINSAIGFYFMSIDEDEGRQSLRAAVVTECRKPLHLLQEPEGHTDSLPSSEEQVTPRFGNP